MRISKNVDSCQKWSQRSLCYFSFFYIESGGVLLGTEVMPQSRGKSDFCSPASQCALALSSYIFARTKRHVSFSQTAFSKCKRRNRAASVEFSACVCVCAGWQATPLLEFNDRNCVTRCSLLFKQISCSARDPPGKGDTGAFLRRASPGFSHSGARTRPCSRAFSIPLCAEGRRS